MELGYISCPVINYSFFCSHDINWASFCDYLLDDHRISVVRPEPALPVTSSRSNEICDIFKLVNRWDECELDVELCGLLSG